MGVRCGLGLHEAESGKVWNDGFYFSRCRRCECELIRRDRSWAPVPAGYRVVWKQREHECFDVSAWSACDEEDAELVTLRNRNWA